MTIQIVLSRAAFEPFLGAITTVTQFKELLGTGLGIITVVSFFFGVLAFMAGVMTRGRNPETSKWCFATSVLLAVAVPAVSLMFAASGQGAAVIEPKF